MRAAAGWLGRGEVRPDLWQRLRTSPCTDDIPTVQPFLLFSIPSSIRGARCGSHGGRRTLNFYAGKPDRGGLTEAIPESINHRATSRTRDRAHGRDARIPIIG